MMDMQQAGTFVAEAVNTLLIVLALVAFPLTVWRSGRVERERRQHYLPGE